MPSKLWAWLKAENRANAKAPRGVAITIPTPRKKIPCVCVHTRKHHTKTGHCRPGCKCPAGANRVT